MLVSTSMVVWLSVSCIARNHQFCWHPQSPFQGKSLHLAAIFAITPGSYFRHARPIIYLYGEITNFQLLAKLTFQLFTKSHVNCVYFRLVHPMQCAESLDSDGFCGNWSFWLLTRRQDMFHHVAHCTFSHS